MENQQNDEIEIDLLELFGVLRARIVSILMTTVLVAAVVGLGTMFLIEPQYQSTSKLYIVSQSSTITSLTDLQAGSQLAQDYIVLVESRPVLEKVISNLGLDMEYEGLLGMISLNNPTDTRILEITVTDNDPYMAKEIVDEIATVSTSRIVSIMNVDKPSTVEYGHLEENPSSPSLKKNVAIGGVAGLFISCAIFIVLYLLNDTVKSEEDVTKYLGLNTLGIIPIEEGAVEQMRRDKRKRKHQSGGFSKRLFKKHHGKS